MKKKLKIDINRIYKIIDKMPYFIILLLIIIAAPLGVWFFIVRTKKTKVKIYNKGKNLTWIAIFLLFLIGVGIYSKVKEIIVLYDSGMSFDMISFVPENLWLYAIGIIMCISYFVGAKKLMTQAKIEKKYIKYINLNKESSLKKISKELSVDIEEVKENIKILQDAGYLISIEIDNKKNKIIYKDIKDKKIVTNNSNRNIKANKTVQCSRCGAIISLKLEEYVECDFCGHGLIEEDSL